MKKILFLGVILAFYLSIGDLSKNKNIIPKEAIRIRILANSNSISDQKKKQQVKDSVESYLYSLLESAHTVEEAEEIIDKNINRLEQIIKDNFKGDFKIDFGLNYFPKKIYKGIIYDEGYYNSLVVSLGEALGDNWWCILYPPLCMLDDNSLSDVEYRSLVGDIISQYFN